MLGLWEGQRFEQNRVDYTENGGVRANADGKRENGDGGEAWLLKELAEGKAEIVHKVAQLPACEVARRPGPPRRFPA